MRAVVIGAGIVGSSVAYHLARGGSDVTLLDAEEPASGTTSRSFAWVNANNKTPKPYFDLNVAGMRENETLQRELDGDWLHITGNTIVSEDADALREKIERLRDWGYEAREISAGEAVGIEPGADLSGAFPDAAIARFDGESWCDAPLAARTISETAKSLGAEVRTGSEVVGLDFGGEEVTLTLSDGSALKSNAVINAAGPDGASVAAMVGREMPLDVFPGLITRITSPPNALRGLLHTPKINLRPDGAGFLAIHHDSVDEEITESADLNTLAAELLDRAKRVIPALKQSEVTELRPGRRPVPGDGYSCVGAVSDVPGYYEALTHSGVTLGPLIGRLLASEILTGEMDLLLTSFRPDRF